MPLDPDEWRDELVGRLDARAPAIARFEAYYEGEHALAFTTTKFREAFGNLFAAFADNWMSVVVDAAVERLEVQGYRFGGPEEAADDDAWRVHQVNNLDAELATGFETAVATGYGYLLTSPNPDDPDTPRITVEHPLEVIVASAPGNRRRREAALKKWTEDDGTTNATLYLPDAVHKWKTDRPARTVWTDRRSVFQTMDERGVWTPLPAEGATAKWIPRDDDTDEDGFADENPLGEVPVVPLLNRPKLNGTGRSDLLSAIPIQDAVNKLIADMLVASEFSAFRQRWASGIEVPIDPTTGNPVRKVFDAAVDRIFATGNEDARFGDFASTDLGNFVKAVEMLVQHLAAQTRTPPHYLLGQSGAFPSGESLKSTETGLVARVRRKHISFGESLEEAQRLGFKLRGDERAEVRSSETIWRDPESRTEGELVDGLLKLKTIDVPIEALWERLGASPQQIKRWKVMGEDERLRAAAADNVRVFGPGGQGAPAEVPPASAGAITTGE